MNKLAMTAAMVPAVLVLAVLGYTLLPALGIIGPGAAASPSPTLLARGSFVEHDWGLVEFEATREGSAVNGRMTVGRGRGPEWPLVVDLRCARTTADGLLLIGGYTTRGPAVARAIPGAVAGMAIMGGSPVRGVVWAGGLNNVPATLTTDCLAFLDAWLAYSRAASPGQQWQPPTAVGGEGTVEFGR